ncbi:MAG: Planctomycete cytochrome [Schlesneria sp.]|nr:Planctomycete cytochrome [Schlesneria sp.]
MLVNGHLIKADAANKVTGSWTPESQTWFVEGFVTLSAGRNIVRLEQPQAFPHIDKLLLTPVDAAAVPGDQIADGKSAASKLIPSLVQQWAKGLEASRSTPQSIFTAWHQFIASKSLVADSSAPHNGVARLLADAQLTSLAELANRYEKLFAEAQQAWQNLKATPEGKDAQALPDPVLEPFRSLLQDPKGLFAVPADIETAFSPETVDQLKAGREELSRRDAAVPQFVETMSVVDSTPENLKIHLRGSHLTLGREVARQLPRILAGEDPRTLTEGSGRLQLALAGRSRSSFNEPGDGQSNLAMALRSRAGSVARQFRPTGRTAIASCVTGLAGQRVHRKREQP